LLKVQLQRLTGQIQNDVLVNFSDGRISNYINTPSIPYRIEKTPEQLSEELRATRMPGFNNQQLK
jgi:hypothetical protein